MARKRRTRPNPGRQPRPAASARPAPAPVSRAVVPPARLPWTLSLHQKVAVAGIFLAGLPSFVSLADRFDTLDDYPVLPGALTALTLAFGYVLERDVIDRRTRQMLRFAGFGVLAPVAVAFVGYAALTPISVLVGLSAYRLGVGAVTPPSVVAALGTLLVTGSPTSAYLVAAAAMWPGTGVHLLTRDRP